MALSKRQALSTPNVNKVICCDASAAGFLGAVVCNDFYFAHKLVTTEECLESSTWRELNTILFALNSFLPFVKDSEVKVFTDSQRAERLVEVGSSHH